jgi:hypothetical protein
MSVKTYSRKPRVAEITYECGCELTEIDEVCSSYNLCPKHRVEMRGEGEECKCGHDRNMHDYGFRCVKFNCDCKRFD